MTLQLYFSLCEKCPKVEFFLVRIFPVFGLYTKIYGVNFRIQSEYGKVLTRKNSVFGYFSRNVCVKMWKHLVFEFFSIAWQLVDGDHHLITEDLFRAFCQLMSFLKRQPFKHQPRKMVKHTQETVWVFELFECVWRFCEVGA